MSLEAQEVAVRVRLLGGTAFETEASGVAGSIRNIGRVSRETDAELSACGAAGFLGGAGKALDTLQGKLTSFSQKAHQIGRQTAALSLGAGFLIYEGIKEHSESEAAFTRLETLARLTHKQREALEQLAPAYKTYGASVRNVAEDIYPIFSDFKNMPKSLEVLKASLEGARVGHAPKADAAWILSSFTKAGFKDVHGGPKEIMSLILQATQEGKMTLPSLIAAARSSFFPLVQATHMSLRDALSALGAASRVGNEPDSYATLLRTAIVKAQAIKGGALTDAKKLGFTGGQPELDILTKEEGGWIRMLRRILQAYAKAGPQGSKGRAEAEGWAANMFGGSRSFGTIATQLATLKSQEEIHRNLDKTHGSGVMDWMFGKSSKTIQAQIENLGATVHNFLNELGASFAPGVLSALKDVVSVLGEVVKGFNGLPKPVKSLITGLLVFAAVLSPAAFLLGGLARGFGLMLWPLKMMVNVVRAAKWGGAASELGLLDAGIGKAGTSAGKFRGMLGSLATVMGVGGAAYMALQAFDSILPESHGLTNDIKSLFTGDQVGEQRVRRADEVKWGKHLHHPHLDSKQKQLAAMSQQEYLDYMNHVGKFEIHVHSHVELDGKKVGSSKQLVRSIEKTQRETHNHR